MTESVIILVAIIGATLWLRRLIYQLGVSMAVDFAKLEASVKAEADAETAVETLLTTLTAEIKAISAGSSDPATQAKLDQLAADTDARTAALSAATVANTPAA